MKAMLNHVAIQKVAKHINANTAKQLEEFLLAEGYIKAEGLFTKGHHQFVLSGGGHHWVISHRKVMEAVS